MDLRHYNDYFSVPENYRANMTREAINESSDTWMDFYPHRKYIEFLQTMLDGIKSGGKSVWLTGNYGTGKSNAALVTQKLFMDDAKRVKRWFEDKRKAMLDKASLERELFAYREEGTLVVYDYNASGVGANEELLVRLEKGIIAALKEHDMSVPFKGNLDLIMERIRREGQRFFDVRDEIQNELTYLNPEYRCAEQLITALGQIDSDTDAKTHLLEDIQTVLHKDDIYLNLDTNTFRQWITAIREANKLERVIYIFDEFSDFIDENITHLKTFEEVTEAPGINRFYLVPVTHLEIEAFWSETSANAGKAGERFYFRNLQMPSDIAFRLAANAFRENPDPEVKRKWEEERNNLWQSVSSVAEMFSADDVSRQSFYDILPIHPMAAFLLKHLSESARSNQRSIFEYLKGSADGREFRDFIRTGGPAIPNKQFLTVDYLWKYFIERDDLGLNKEIVNIRSEFERIRVRNFAGRTDEDEDVRVLKAVLLFCLLSRLNPDGHDMLRPTVRNIELSFQGDGTIVDVRGIINSLRDKHCFSVINDNIELFAATVQGADLQDKIKELEPKFDELICPKVCEALTEHTKSARSKHSANRFDIRVSDFAHTTLTNITQQTRIKYSEGQNNDSGSICLWFVVAKNKKEQLLIPEKIEAILNQLRDHRIMFFTFPGITFCSSNSESWSEYITQYAQYLLENNETAKKQIKGAYERMEREWTAELKKPEQRVRCYSVLNGKMIVQDKSWAGFSTLISEYERIKLPGCVDCLTDWVSAYSDKGLGRWATAGILYNASSGQEKQLVEAFKNQDITLEKEWYAQNPDHPIARIRALLDKKIANTLGKGTTLSIRKVYIELQRAPYGMKNNALSAFVLGCVLRDILEKDYQWDNGQITKPLDTATLAGIIEEVVKDDGQDKIKLEKLICRLSKQQRAFIEYAPKMFGCVPISDATLSSVILQIQNRIEDVSNRVPLWILPEYIHSVGADKADEIEQVLKDVCEACAISSKGKAEEKTDAINRIGETTLANPTIVDEIATYVRGQYFVLAFQMYVDRTANLLKELAESLGDHTHNYCVAILDKARLSSGILWNQVDIGREIEETENEYKVIETVQKLFDTHGFMSYKDVYHVLRNSLIVTNKLPKTMLEAEHPSLCSFISAVLKEEGAAELRDSLANNFDIAKALFFDAEKTEGVRILKKRLKISDVDDKIVGQILGDMDAGFDSNEGAFLKEAMQRLEELQKASVIHNLKRAWCELSGKETPDEWAKINKIPAVYLFEDVPDVLPIVKAVQEPSAFSSEKLEEYLEKLRSCVSQSISECQAAFRKEMIPDQYAKFKIDLASLIHFLRMKYGNQPNQWPNKPDVTDFIVEQYEVSIAPQIVEKISNKSPEELKQKLVKMAQSKPEIGLLFWEDEDGLHN